MAVLAALRTASTWKAANSASRPALPFGARARRRVARRVLFGAAGGAFHGARLRGEVVPGGGDWALFGPAGTMRLDVRLTLRTHDDALIRMTYTGRRTAPGDPAATTESYFRTTPLFETGAGPYTWLNDIVCVGSGYLVDGGVAYRVAQVL
ncbi:DUF3237 domain-containing protein [Streptomyces sp. NPDC053086]|uniref:DUF3237 domain-containing protein n=1 Tax=unclassified Streptomyces TaxID=2593676 RepID=UPI0037D71BD5